MNMYPHETARGTAPVPQWARRAGLAVLGLLIAWLVVTRSFTAWLAHDAPATALSLDASQPAALLALADRALAEQGKKRAARPDSEAATPEKATPGPPASTGSWDPIETSSTAVEESARPAAVPVSAPVTEAIRRDVEQALARDPLNAHALRLLGQLAIAAGDKRAADRLMAASARRSQLESLAVYWLMRRGFESGDYAAALRNADALLRSRSPAGRFVMPFVGRMLARKEAQGPLLEMLARNPPWRGRLFASLDGNVPDARAPLNILMALEDTTAPPTPEELRGYLDVLTRYKHYEFAYYAWLQFRTADELATTGRLINGSFERPPSGLPFDWRLKQGNGVTVDRVPRADKEGQHALAIEFGHGRVDFSSVEQLTLLPPGAYRLEGTHMGQISGRRGLVWRVVCAETGKVIGQSPMLIGVSPQWRVMQFEFTVPQAGCRAQTVRLDLDARSASEQLVAGSITFDDLAITRLP